MKQQPTKQIAQEPIKSVQEPIKSIQEPIRTEPEVVRENEAERVIDQTTCSTCARVKPDFKKAVKIAVKGNAIAAAATAVVAAPVVIKSGNLI